MFRPPSAATEKYCHGRNNAPAAGRAEHVARLPSSRTNGGRHGSLTALAGPMRWPSLTRPKHIGRSGFAAKSSSRRLSRKPSDAEATCDRSLSFERGGHGHGIVPSRSQRSNAWCRVTRAVAALPSQAHPQQSRRGDGAQRSTKHDSARCSRATRLA